MARITRSPARGGRPGLTLTELLAAIAVTGVLLTLLLPRLASAPPPAPAGCPFLAGSAGSCPWACQWRAEPGLAERGFIGVQLGPERTGDGYLWIRQPMPGRPAQQAGARPGDVILRVDGRSTRNRSSDEVVDWITRGRPGTPVRLTVRRYGSDQRAELRILRGSFLSVFLPGFSVYR
jgi:prepilin-type N-terminal cleavage/methylation domain-containing protein